MKYGNILKWGAAAALYEALAYIVGIAGFLLGVNISEISDPRQKVAALLEYQDFLTFLNIFVYVFFGISLVVLVLAMHEHLNGRKSALTLSATAFGLIWSVLVIASGMIYIIGIETIAAVNAFDPVQAATVWLAIESVFDGLGGGVEVLGGLWVLLLSLTALRQGILSPVLCFFGTIVGGAGLITVVPVLAEAGGVIFGLTQIIWFIWIGIVLLKSGSDLATG